MANEVNSILEYPAEIVEMILSHLDMKKCKIVALVCPTFYEHVCYRPQRLLLRENVSLPKLTTNNGKISKTV